MPAQDTSPTTWSSALASSSDAPRPAATHAAPPPLPASASPWVLSNPNTPRTPGLCPFCGPGFDHTLRYCIPNAAYQQTSGAVRMPNFEQFPIGSTYADAKAKMEN